MFEFCRTELGYTENEAFSRIAAMRLSREVPEVVQAVEDGRLSLTNLAQAQSFFRKSEKPVPVEEKRKVLQELEGMSTRECKKKFMPEGMQRKTFEVDDELLADLKRIRELWGNQDLSDTELLRKMAKQVLSRIDPGLKKSVGAPKVNVAGCADLDPARSGDEAAMEEVPAEMITPESRGIPAAIKREVWRRDGGRCTYAHTGRRCTSRYALQFDHVVLYSHGGAHTAVNIRLLCRAHHRMKSGVAA